MKVRPAAILLEVWLLAGCTYYETAPGYYVQAPAPVSGFDRSWSAAVGAFAEQGVRIVSEDRQSGMLRGMRDGIDLTAYVTPRPDGSVRVEFNTAGATQLDPDLINRVTRPYNRYMGR